MAQLSIQMYCAGNLTGHRSSVTAVACPPPHYVAGVPDSYWETHPTVKKYKLITGSRDNTIIIWGDEATSTTKRNSDPTSPCVDSDNDDDAEEESNNTYIDKSQISKNQKRKLARKKRKMMHSQKDGGGGGAAASATATNASTISTSSTAEAPLASAIRRLEGHTGFISDLCISRDGRMVLSASWDRSLRLWEIETGNLICKCVAGGNGGHTKDALSCSLVEFEVALHQQPKSEATTNKQQNDHDNDYDVEPKATHHRHHQHHHQQVNSYVLAFSSGRDNTIRLWNLPIYENCNYLGGNHQNNPNTKNSFYRYNSVGQCIRVFTGHQDWVSSVKWICPGRLDKKQDWTFEKGLGVQLMEESEYLDFASASWDGTLVHWKVRFKDIWSTLVVLMSTPPSAKATFEPPVLDLGVGLNCSNNNNSSSTISSEIFAKQVTKAHEGCITNLSVSPDGSLVTTCGKDGSFKLWDFSHMPTQPSFVQLDFIFAIKNFDTYGSPTEPLFQVAYSPNKYWMAVISESAVRVYDLESKRVLATCSSPQDFQYVKTPPSPTFCTFTRDSDTLYVGYSDNIVRVFCIVDTSVLRPPVSWDPSN